MTIRMSEDFKVAYKRLKKEQRAKNKEQRIIFDNIGNFGPDKNNNLTA